MTVVPLRSAGGGNPSFGGVNVPPQYAGIITLAAAQYHVRPALLAAQLEQESGFNPRAVSSAGAEGIAQWEPGTAAAEGVNPYDPHSAILGMARLDAAYISQFGSEASALAAYNLGPDAVTPGSVPSAAKDYVNRILGMAGGSGTSTTGGTTSTPGPVSPIASVFAHLTSGAFYRRIGLGLLGALIIALSLGFAFSRTSAGRAVRKSAEHVAEVAAVA